MQKIKNYLVKHKNGLVAMVAGLGLVVGQTMFAAVDSDLTTALASSTSMVSDNKGTILTFFAGIVAVLLVISLGKVALFKSKAMIVSAFAGRKKRK